MVPESRVNLACKESLGQRGILVLPPCSREKRRPRVSMEKVARASSLAVSTLARVSIFEDEGI